MITQTISPLSRPGSTPWILPRPTWQSRLRNLARVAAQVLAVTVHIAPVSLGLGLGLLLANLLGVVR